MSLVQPPVQSRTSFKTDEVSQLAEKAGSYDRRRRRVTKSSA